jgi:S1-C subfamily serine protease
MNARAATVLLALVLLPALWIWEPSPGSPRTPAATAAPTGREARFDPRETSALPSYVQRVEGALVGLSVKAAPDRPSSARLGAQRFGTGIVFDSRGYAVTVSYVVLDALSIEARLRDGRTVPATLTGMDLDAGLAVVRLQGAGPWKTADLAGSQDLQVGAVTGTAGLDEDGDLVHATTRLTAVRRFSAFWEYMLDRALMLAPSMPSWGGSAALDDRGRVVGVVSLRLGEPPHVNLAIPIEKFVAVKDELIAAGRVVSRRPRPWLGLHTTAERDAVYVDGFNDAGPAVGAGFRKGDQIVGVGGVRVGSQEEFYEQLWRHQAGETIELAVLRNARVRTIRVRSIDRYRLYRTAQ